MGAARAQPCGTRAEPAISSPQRHKNRTGTMRKKRTPELLTSVELELMTTLWRLGRGTVRDVVDHESNSGKRAYTSVATVMKILEQKGFVSAEKQDRWLIYQPAISKSDYQLRSLKDISRTLFEDTPSALVARLVDDEDLSPEMIEEIRALLDARIGNDKS